MRTVSILIANADSATAGALPQRLVPLGCAIEEADSTATSVALLRTHRPQLVVVNGDSSPDHALVRQLRAATAAHTPIVLLAVQCDFDLRQSATLAGATLVLEQLTDDLTLVANIAQLLEAQRLRESEQQLLSFIVHDLKQPIFAIAANAQWLLSYELPRQASDAIADILESSDALGRMVDDLLSVAKLEHKQLTLKKQALRLADFLARLEKATKRAPSEVILRFAAGSDPDVLVSVDQNLIERVVGNIVQNAFRYAATAIYVTPVIRADTFELHICNDGPRIPVEHRGHVFEKFVQASGDHADGSVGLGLYFCKLVVEAHGGTIAVEEAPAWPVDFVVTLPNNVLAPPLTAE